MNVGPYEMITDRVSPQTIWGYQDANRICGAINYIQAKLGATAYAFLSADNTAGEFPISPSGTITVTLAVYAVKDKGCRHPLQTSTVTISVGGSASGSVTYGGMQYLAQVRSTGATVGGMYQDNDNYKCRLKSASVAGEGQRVFTYPAYAGWELNQLPTWADINTGLFLPWYELTRLFGVYGVLDFPWTMWGGYSITVDEEGIGPVTEYKRQPFDADAANKLEEGIAMAWRWHTNANPLFTGAAYTGAYIGG